MVGNVVTHERLVLLRRRHEEITGVRGQARHLKPQRRTKRTYDGGFLLQDTLLARLRLRRPRFLHLLSVICSRLPQRRKAKGTNAQDKRKRSQEGRLHNGGGIRNARLHEKE